jgi:hypothetical protein
MYNSTLTLTSYSITSHYTSPLCTVRTSLLLSGMERLALLLINGRGVPQRDAQRAVQLMLHALSHISSGQSKISGVQALLKQLVLSYRIVFLRLCEFLRARLSLKYVHRAVVRVRDRIKSMSMYRHGQGQGQGQGQGRERYRYPSDDSKASTALHCTAVLLSHCRSLHRASSLNCNAAPPRFTWLQ